MQDYVESQVTSQNPGRREFFSQFAAGAVGFAANPLNKESDGTSDVECKASVADSLMFYFQLVIRVHSELDMAVSKPYEHQGEIMEDMFKRLLEQIRILESEIRKSPVTAKARQMRELAELGRSNARLIKAGFGSRNEMQLSTYALAVVSSQVCQQAEALLPTGPVTLNPAATEALKKIICIVEEEQTRRENAKLRTGGADKAEAGEKETLTTELNHIQREIQNVMDAIWKAAEASAKADRVSADAAALRLQAKADLGIAISKLQALKIKYGEQLRELSSSPESQYTSLSIDLFIDILTGAQKWVEDPGILITAIKYEEPRSQFRTIANWSRGSMPASLWSNIGSALSQSCEADTWLRRAWCLSLIGPILIQHSDTDSRKPRIERVLDLFRCPYGGSIAGLADLLARL